MGNIQTIADQEFDTTVLQANQPVLVYFWASWCGPCRLMAPVLDGLSASYGDRLKIIKMEVDANPAAVAAYQVEGVPAFRLFIDGELVHTAEGAMPKAKLEEMINTHLALA